MFGLTNKDMVTGGISSQGSHNYAMCFHINTSPYIFILSGSLADISHNLIIVEKRLPADSVSIILSDRYDAFIWDENTMLISFWCRQFYVSVFDLSCSTGWSNSKISSENYTNTAESISNEPGVLIPHVHCLGSAIIAFSVVQTRRAASTNTPKIWYLHWNTE